MEWTKEQEQCFTKKRGSLLVSAAAGSGKTSVLIERIFTRITDDEHPIDIDRLIVTTFTDAAADEMKQRLYERLSEALVKDPHNKRLQRQLFLLPHASISTIHGVCGWLLREHAHELDIAPDYTIVEGTAATTLWDEAVNEAIEAFHDEGRNDFRALMDAVCREKNDAPLKRAIDNLQAFLNSHAFPDEWVAEQLSRMNAPCLWETAWGHALRRSYENEVRKAIDFAKRAVAMAGENTELSACYLLPIERYQSELDSLLTAEAFSSWDGFWERLLSVSAPAYDSVSKQGKPIETLLKASYKVLKDICPKNRLYTEAEVRSMLIASRPLIAALWELVQNARARFYEKKKAIRKLDFNDLEHLALKLLWEKSENGYVPTALARDIGEQFDEIYVDEYQDCNETQERIFIALSQEENNLFFVGDVKQSIYGFRQAQPKLFIERRRAYTPFDDEHFPAVIALNQNFRSRKEVTDAVNFLFCQLMTDETCHIAYQGNEELHPHAHYEATPHDDQYRTSLLVVEHAGNAKARRVAEAEAIAAEIRRHMANSLVRTKEGGFRQAEYSDFCILLRSTKTSSTFYVETLNRLGIPTTGAVSDEFFTTREISLAVSFLRIIDNPSLDIPLTAVLMSPLYGFTPDDLAAIRVYTPKRRLYTALEQYGRTEGELAARVRAFLHDLSTYRTLAATIPAHRLLRRLYEKTGLLSLMAADTHGEQRRANLQLLYDKACGYEEHGFRGTSAFVQHLMRIQTRANQNDIMPATVPLAQKNAVKVLTIHHSKGLEFPFVFVADMSHHFNTSDLNNDLLLHAEVGVGLRLVDNETLVQKKPPMWEGVACAISRTLYNEEMRLLYVAATRAREQLTFVTSQNKASESLTKLAAFVPAKGALPPHAVWGAKSFGDWVMMAALRHPSGAELRRLAGVEDLPLYPADDVWDIRILTSKPNVEEATESSALPDPAPDPELAALLKERLAYTYPYAALGHIPNKLAASDLSHTVRDRSLTATARPAFLMNGKMSPTARGTAMHTFMQFADFSAAAENLEREITRLAEKRFLTKEQADSLSRSKLNAFFASELYRRMRQSNRIWREIPFTVGIPACDLMPEACATLPPAFAAEEIAVQGIADCVFEEQGNLVIVDYKTDRIHTSEELRERYHRQLEIYATALSRSFALPVSECLLYSFSLDETVVVPLPQ